MKYCAIQIVAVAGTLLNNEKYSTGFTTKKKSQDHLCAQKQMLYASFPRRKLHCLTYTVAGFSGCVHGTKRNDQ